MKLESKPCAPSVKTRAQPGRGLRTSYVASTQRAVSLIVTASRRTWQKLVSGRSEVPFSVRRAPNCDRFSIRETAGQTAGLTLETACYGRGDTGRRIRRLRSRINELGRMMPRCFEPRTHF